MIIFLSSSGNAIDPLEERMTKMEKKMNAFISRMENAMMRMTEEIVPSKSRILLKLRNMATTTRMILHQESTHH